MTAGSGWKLVSLDAVSPSPWRNGGGVTRELLAFPSATKWRARISVADIAQASPFSRFPRVERLFAVLAGPGVIVRIGDASSELTPRSKPTALQSYSFRHPAAAAPVPGEQTLEVQLNWEVVSKHSTSALTSSHA